MSAGTQNRIFKPGLNPWKGLLCWLPVGLWYGGICYVSSLSSPSVGELPFLHFDKLAHAVMFMGLSVLMFVGLHSTTMFRPGICALLAFLCTCLGGGVDEIHQSFVHGRHADIMDWAADTVGAAGSFGMLMIKRYRKPA